MPKTAYIKIVPSHAKNVRYEAGKERLEAMNRLEWAEVLQAIFDLGQASPEESAGWLDLLQETLEDSKGIGNLTALKLNHTFQDILNDFRRDLEATHIPEEDIFYLEYDPTEWFSEPGRNFRQFTSGRMFALAAAGVLQAQGIPVYGTGIAEEPEGLNS